MSVAPRRRYLKPMLSLILARCLFGSLVCVFTYGLFLAYQMREYFEHLAREQVMRVEAEEAARRQPGRTLSEVDRG